MPATRLISFRVPTHPALDFTCENSNGVIATFLEKRARIEAVIRRSAERKEVLLKRRGVLQEGDENILNPDPSLEFEKNFAKREQLEGNFASRTVSVPRYVRNAEAQNSIPDAMLSRNFAEENLHENVPVSKMASKPTGSDSGENQIRSNDGSGLNGAVLSISPQRKSSKKLQSSASPDHLRPPLSIFFSTPVAPLETANPSPPAPNSVITNRIAEKILALKESAKEKKR